MRRRTNIATNGEIRSSCIRYSLVDCTTLHNSVLFSRSSFFFLFLILHAFHMHDSHSSYLTQNNPSIACFHESCVNFNPVKEFSGEVLQNGTFCMPFHRSILSIDSVIATTHVGYGTFRRIFILREKCTPTLRIFKREVLS